MKQEPNPVIGLLTFAGCMAVTLVGVWVAGWLSEQFLLPQTEAYVWRVVAAGMLAGQLWSWAAKRV